MVDVFVGVAVKPPGVGEITNMFGGMVTGSDKRKFSTIASREAVKWK